MSTDHSKEVLGTIAGFWRSLGAFALDCLLLGIIGAVAGYPNITVPAGRVKDLRVGLCFVGTRCSEPVLIQAAYAYEQATRHATTLKARTPGCWSSAGPASKPIGIGFRLEGAETSHRQDLFALRTWVTG